MMAVMTRQPDHDLHMLRFHMEKALDCVERLVREICPDDDAYSELDCLREQYLGDNAFQQLALAEKAHKELMEREASGGCAASGSAAGAACSPGRDTVRKDLKQKWDDAERTGEPQPLGDLVVCDVCDRDYTNSTEEGGFIFGSYAYCPTCAERHLPKIQGYNEEHMIRARCGDGVSFADFVRAYRGPDAAIRIGKLERR